MRTGRTAAGAAAAAAPQRRGAALFLSLILITVVMIMSAGVVQLSSHSSRMQRRSLDQLKAFYLAEAGLAEAFDAVSMGRSGAIASDDDPARYGDGTVWVSSVQTSDGRLWLEANARAGVGRATLGLVLDPAEPSLGFFADEDIVIESVVLVDGFDSSATPYEVELIKVEQRRLVDGLTGPGGQELVPLQPDPQSPHFAAQLELQAMAAALPSGVNARLVVADIVMWSIDGDGGSSLPPFPSTVEAAVTSSITDVPRFVDAFLAGALFGPSQPTMKGGGETETEIDDGMTVTESEFGEKELTTWEPAVVQDPPLTNTQDRLIQKPTYESKTQPIDTDPVTSVVQEPIPTGGGGGSQVDSAFEARLAVHTDHGGLLSTNGNITFQSDAPAKIMGSLEPGPDGTLNASAGLDVSGSTRARDLAVELPQVIVPTVHELPAIDHSSAVPLLVSAEDAAYPEIHVRAGAEVVLRGPARIVADSIRVDAGGLLVLDTQEGNVEIYAKNALDLGAGALIETTALSSKEVTLFGTDSGAPFDLRAAGSFHGTIMAPDSSVTIGSDFEVFGGIVARRLEIKAGARLHFDDPGYSKRTKLPTQEAWRILELPDRGGAVAALVPPAAPRLATAHELDVVSLDLEYVDKLGTTKTFVGAETAFDWTKVASVKKVERAVDRTAITEAQEAALREAWARKAKEKASTEPAPVTAADAAPKPLTAGDKTDTVDARVASEAFAEASDAERREKVAEAIRLIVEAHGKTTEEYRVFGDHILSVETLNKQFWFELYRADRSYIGWGNIDDLGGVTFKGGF